MDPRRARFMGSLCYRTEVGGGRLVAVLLRFEDDALVELGERQRDSDLRQGENGVGDQDFVRPGIAGAGVDGGADAVLFEHDVTLDGRRRLILAGFDDPVVAPPCLG